MSARSFGAITIQNPFPPTRREALERLESFSPRAGRAYAAGRNFDLGADRREAVSNLSPYLRYRLITEREVVAAVLDHHGQTDAEKFIQEVLWRTYWKGWLEARPEAWTRFIADRDAAKESLNGGLASAVEKAEAGATGIEGFDDWARELVDTGYLHNHARMWLASIWIFTLRLPWVLGADFFLRHLVDADPASNTLSWRWVAGLQTKGKTYLATADNIARYTEGRFRPRDLARRADALTEPPLPAARRANDLPPGRFDGPALLLITPEDLDPVSLLPSHVRIGSVLGISGVQGWPWGEKARAFVDHATADASKRAGEAFDCTCETTESFSTDAVVAAASKIGASEIVTAFAPVGPIADAMARQESVLATAGLSLVRRRRSWDELFWPHATKGFYGLKEHIQGVLTEEGLPA